MTTPNLPPRPPFNRGDIPAAPSGLPNKLPARPGMPNTPSQKPQNPPLSPSHLDVNNLADPRFVEPDRSLQRNFQRPSNPYQDRLQTPVQQPTHNSPSLQNAPSQHSGYNSAQQQQLPVQRQQQVPVSPQKKVPSYMEQPGDVKTKKQKPNGLLVAMIIILIICLGGAGWYLNTLSSQIDTLEMEKQDLEYSNETIEKEKETLKEQVDAKEEFKVAMQSLMTELHGFEGTLYKERINVENIDYLVQDAYLYRESPEDVKEITMEIELITAKLKLVKETWATQKGNATNTPWEKLADDISGGYTTIVMYDYNNNICSARASGCVNSGNPSEIKLNWSEYHNAKNYWGENRATWWFNGVVWHEYAHVLQFTNYAVTSKYMPQFNNDYESMADCYVAVFYSPDFPSESYDRGCSGAQLDAIRSWVEEMKFKTPTFVQKDA